MSANALAALRARAGFRTPVVEEPTELPAAPSALAVTISDTVVAADLAWADNDQTATQYVHRLTTNTAPTDSSTRISDALAAGVMAWSDESPVRGARAWYAVESTNAAGSRYSTPVRGFVPDYYVDPVGGSDAADGTTPATAWATATPVASMAGGSSVGFIGTLEAEVSPPSGTAGNPTILCGVGGGDWSTIQGSTERDAADWTFESTVSGGDRYSTPWPVTDPLFCWSTDGTDRNLPKAADLASCVDPDDWFFSFAVLYTVVPQGAGPPSGFHIGTRNRCVNGGIGKSYVELIDLRLRFAQGTGVNGVVYGKHSTNPSTGWVFDGCLLEWGAGSGVQMSGVSFTNGATITFRDTEIRYMREHSVQAEFYTATVEGNNYWHAPGRCNLSHVWRNSEVADLTLADSGDALALWHSPATKFAWDSDVYSAGVATTLTTAGGNRYAGITSYRPVRSSFAVDALSNDNTFDHCVSVDAAVFAFFLEGGTNNGSRGNRVLHCTAVGAQKSALHVNNGHGSFEARNCLFVDCAQDGTSQLVYIQFQIAGSWAPHPTVAGIYQRANVQWVPSEVGSAAGSPLTQAASVAAMTAGSWFFENAGDDTGTLYLWKSDSSAVTEAITLPADGYVLDYNGYSQTLAGTAKMIRLNLPSGAYNYTTLAELQAAHPTLEANGVQSDLWFVDQAGEDFTLTDGSPAVDAGVAISGITDTVLGSAPDLGAIESDATPAEEPEEPTVGTPSASISTSVDHATGVITATPTFAASAGETITSAVLSLRTVGDAELEADSTLTSGSAVVFGTQPDGTYVVRLVVGQSDTGARTVSLQVVLDSTAPEGLLTFAADDPFRYLMGEMTVAGDGATVTAVQPYPFFDATYASHVEGTMDAWPERNPCKPLVCYVSIGGSTSRTVTGNADAQFLTDLEVGSWIRMCPINNTWAGPFQVVSIESNQSLTIDRNFGTWGSGSSAFSSITDGLLAPLPFGTVSVDPAVSTTEVVGVGTRFTTDLDPNDLYAIRDTGGNWRSGYRITITDDTHLTISPAWAYTAVTGANHSVDQATTIGTYKDNDRPAAYLKGYGNYYDSVWCAFVHAKRTGSSENLERARKGARVWYESEWHHSGYGTKPPAPRESGMLGLMAWAIDRDQNGEEGAHNVWGHTWNSIVGLGPNSYGGSWLSATNVEPATSPGIYSMRDQGYALGMLAFAGRVLPDTFLSHDGVTVITDGAAKRAEMMERAVYCAWQFFAYHQRADGGWAWYDGDFRDWDKFCQPWMCGLMLEGMIECHKYTLEDAAYQVPGEGLNGMSVEETLRTCIIKAARWLRGMVWHNVPPVSGESWNWGMSYYTVYNATEYGYLTLLPGPVDVPAGSGGDVTITCATGGLEGSKLDFPDQPIGVWNLKAGTIDTTAGANYAAGGGVTNGDTLVTRASAQWGLAHIGGEIRLGSNLAISSVSIDPGVNPRTVTGTNFLARLTEGKSYIIKQNGSSDRTVTVESIDSDTQCTLSADWTYGAQVGVPMTGSWWDTIADVLSTTSLRTTRAWPFDTATSVSIQWFAGTKVAGVGTSFLTDYTPGQLWWYGMSNGKMRVARIDTIESDTVMYLRRTDYIGAVLGAVHGQLEGSALPGLIDVVGGNTSIVGHGTQFTDLSPGDKFWFVVESKGGYTEAATKSFRWYELEVASVTDDENMTVVTGPPLNVEDNINITQTLCNIALHPSNYVYVRSVDSDTTATIGPYTGPALTDTHLRATYAAPFWNGTTDSIRDQRQNSVESIHALAYAAKISGEAALLATWEEMMEANYGIGLPGNDGYGFQHTKSHLYYGWHMQNGAQALRSSPRGLGWSQGA